MSRIFTLSAEESILNATIFPPIQLESDREYGIGMRSFMSYNTISNIKTNLSDRFYIVGMPTIVFPTGTYGMEDIFEFIETRVKEEVRQSKQKLSSMIEHSIKFGVDRNTGRVNFQATFDVDMTKDDSIGPLLGFTAKNILNKNQVHLAPSPVDIFNYSSIHIECNLLASDSSYFNSSPSTILHSFCPDVEVNFRINYAPSPMTYLRINRNVIDFIQLRVVDERGSLLDFRKENITIVLELVPL